MYNTEVFELAMKACAYKIDRIWYNDNTRHVKKVHGQVPVAKKVTINGKRETVFEWKAFRWNDAGQCFSRHFSIRRREYDLPLSTIVEQLKRERL